MEKFSIDIETYYMPDTGDQSDVFGLSSAEKRQRTVGKLRLLPLSVPHNVDGRRFPPPPADPIDIVKDYIAPHEYLAEEDPRLYRSLKTGRGPLSEDWIQEINRSPGDRSVMCAYKLCKVEFRYWGMQSKIERFIHDMGKRERPTSDTKAVRSTKGAIGSPPWQRSPTSSFLAPNRTRLLVNSFSRLSFCESPVGQSAVGIVIPAANDPSRKKTRSILHLPCRARWDEGHWSCRRRPRRSA